MSRLAPPPDGVTRLGDLLETTALEHAGLTGIYPLAGS